MYKNWFQSEGHDVFCWAGRVVTAVLVLAVLGSLSACATYQGGKDIAQSRQIVEKANMTFSNFIHDTSMGWVRANLPKVSDWPTFPQLFVDGELVGGCDIMTDMYQKGELKTLLDDSAAAREGQEQQA